MGSKFRFVVVAVTAGMVLAIVGNLSASLWNYPPSFVIPLQDNEHIFVMLSRRPLADDDGNEYTLPDGLRVNLRREFPASGLYAIGSFTPIWTVDWIGEKGLLKFSEDGRYMIRINSFGGGGYGGEVNLNWGLKFYKNGKEFKTIDTGELVDYPKLMAYSLYGYHLLWIDESVFESGVDGGLFHLKTSCREEYIINIRTGQIVKESRFWRKIFHGFYVVMTFIGLLCVWFFYRRHKKRRAIQDQAAITQENPAFPVAGLKMFQYGLRSLIILMTTIAGLCSLGCTLGLCYAIFGSGIVFAILLTCLLRKRRRLLRGVPMTWAMRCVSLGWWMATFASWFLVYALSSVPVCALIRYFRWPEDVHNLFIHYIYFPVYQLLMHSPAWAHKIYGLYVNGFGR
jgi:hypothetical protein